MDSRRNRDRLSTLPEHLLVPIISNLPFEEAVRTSVLAKPWKHLYHGTTNVSFKESEFVKRTVSSSEESLNEARAAFVRFVVNWASRFSGDVIQSFELRLSKPFVFEAEIKHLIEFAVSKQVKTLVLDFSDLSCTASNQARPAVQFQLPECVYNQTAIESLKLFACGFDPLRLANPCSFKSVCFGHTQLGRIMTLLSKSPLLESLTVRNCWNVNLESITGVNNRLRELVFENCDFGTEYTLLDLPNIKIFKYTGSFHYFQFLTVNRRMEEAYLDYGAETDDEIGQLFCDVLYDLLSARKLTVCPFLIKAIKDSDDPVKLNAPMETRHLVIKTSLSPDEFVGIRLMINSCPELETLTLQMLPPVPVARTNPGFNPKSYWAFPISHKCLKKTLKVVEVRNFSGGTYELIVLRYLIRSGRVLERVDLYLPVGTSESEKSSVRATMSTLGDEGVASSKRLRIRQHDG
ncbi:PREDICTED: F-box protein At3g62230 [Brassica oleracea var. oleracea]|uniref:F-box domain-containing protein n=1 Tax=Brassica oleracea var. oleracea TaxID=109376 RepID=A0A0D3BWB2_BRAOL|nr:PREDICTED: F-box protein At3g62230 [Brassica oleracea var. oleracea]